MTKLKRTELDLKVAEMKLREVYAANIARKRSPCFGFESRATLTGDQVAALLGELRRLRGQSETCDDQVVAGRSGT